MVMIVIIIEVLTVLNVKIVLFWVAVRCSLLEITCVSEKPTASIFSVT
jgi:hypothetical protein